MGRENKMLESLKEANSLTDKLIEKQNDLQITLKRMKLEIVIDNALQEMSETEINKDLVLSFIDQINLLNEDGKFLFMDGDKAENRIEFLKLLAV